jgi:hypothetical protein
MIHALERWLGEPFPVLPPPSADACAWLRAQGFVTRAALIDRSLPELQQLLGDHAAAAEAVYRWLWTGFALSLCVGDVAACRPSIRGRVASETTDPHLLRRLANDPEPVVRQGAAVNPALPADLLQRLARDASVAVRRAVGNAVQQRRAEHSATGGAARPQDNPAPPPTQPPVAQPQSGAVPALREASMLGQWAARLLALFPRYRNAAAQWWKESGERAQQAAREAAEQRARRAEERARAAAESEGRVRQAKDDAQRAWQRAAEEGHLNESIPAGLPTVGPATLALLRREHITTRRDLRKRSHEQLQGVHGIGPGRAAILLEWAAKARSDSPFTGGM